MGKFFSDALHGLESISTSLNHNWRTSSGTLIALDGASDWIISAGTEELKRNRTVRKMAEAEDPVNDSAIPLLQLMRGEREA